MLEIILIAAAVYAVGLVADRISCWARRRRALMQNPEYVAQLEQMDATYTPEEPDKILTGQCREYLRGQFPDGVAARTAGMSQQQLLDLFRSLVTDARDMMGVTLDDIDLYSTDTYPECGWYGYYCHAERTIHINTAFILSGRPELVEEQVFTIFHELKHARQWAAVEGSLDGSADFGYSQDLIVSWARNLANYIPCTVDDELYRKQPVENDAFGFENTLRHFAAA